MLKKSLIIATGITLSLFGIILYIGTLYGQYNPGTGTQYPPKHLGQGSRDFGYYFHEVGTTGTYIQYFGTQSVTGSGTAGRITGTSSALPHMKYNYAGGTPTFNYVGGTLQNEGVDVTVSSDLGSYIAVSGGTGTGNVLTNTTLAGAGTISANVSLSGNITANSLLITPTELSSVNNATGEIQTQITTATGSITNHVHSGSDGTTQIAHNSVTGTGTNSHATIDSFIASKAQASGLASLDANSLVDQNPASGTTTPTASKILIADGAGKIADGWLNSTVSLLGQTIALGTETTGNTDNVAEGSSNLYYLDSRVNAAVGSLSVNALSDVNIAFNENDFIKIVGGQLVAGSSSATVAFSAVTGSASASQLPLLSGLLGSATYAQLPTVIRLTGTTTSPEAGAFGQLYVQSSSFNSGDSSDTDTKLLLHMNNPGTSTFIDSSLSVNTITASGNAIGTSTAKFGSGGGYFDGTTDDVTIGSSTDFVFGTGDFTIEMFIRPLVSQSNVTYYSNRNGVNNNVIRLITYSTANAISVHTGAAVMLDGTTALSLGVFTHVAYARQGTTGRLFINGVQDGTSTDTYNYSVNNSVSIGKDGTYVGGTGCPNSVIDEVRISKGIARWTGNFTPPTAPYGTPYTQYSAKYADPVNGNTVFEIKTPGTATTEPSYIYNNATTTVWGLGTNTAITGTTSGAYAGWSNRPIRVSAVDIASTKKIKENIKPIHIKPEQLEAESKAKPVYIADKKPAWFAANETNYTYVGSDTATYVDTAGMESDYASYIELEWASDLNQSVYVDAVQKAQQKYFWGLFDKIQPKSWNPIDNLNMTRKGLVVEEVPDEIKGADGQSIDQMAVATYQTLVLQELKDSILDIMQAMKDLSSAGTFTTQAINDRLEVMRTAP